MKSVLLFKTVRSYYSWARVKSFLQFFFIFFLFCLWTVLAHANAKYCFCFVGVCNCASSASYSIYYEIMKAVTIFLFFISLPSSTKLVRFWMYFSVCSYGVTENFLHFHLKALKLFAGVQVNVSLAKQHC